MPDYHRLTHLHVTTGTPKVHSFPDVWGSSSYAESDVRVAGMADDHDLARMHLADKRFRRVGDQMPKS